MSLTFDPDPYGPYERAYNVEMLQAQVFGAFYAASNFRKSDIGMTNVELARRTGNSRSQISKLMSEPQNWTLKTISELATALDVDFRFVLVDRSSNSRCFDAGGTSFFFGDNSSLMPHANKMYFSPPVTDLTSYTVANARTISARGGKQKLTPQGVQVLSDPIGQFMPITKRS